MPMPTDNQTSNAGKNKTVQKRKSETIVIKGCGAHFNGVYEVDQLILKFMAFVFIWGVIALLFL